MFNETQLVLPFMLHKKKNGGVPRISSGTLKAKSKEAALLSGGTGQTKRVTKGILPKSTKLSGHKKTTSDSQRFLTAKPQVIKDVFNDVTSRKAQSWQ